jgi:hypothetical protein
MSEPSEETSSNNPSVPRTTGGQFVSLSAIAPAFEGRFEKIRRKREKLQQEFEGRGGKCFLCLDSGFEHPGRICTAEGCEAAVREKKNARKEKIRECIQNADIDILDPGYTTKTWRGSATLVAGLRDWCNAYLKATVAELFEDNLQDEKPRILPFAILFGPTGCGKTVISALLLKYAIETKALPGWFCSVPAFLNSQRGLNPDDAAFQRAMNVPFLVMDDIGLTKPSDFTDERLYIVINHRYTKRMWTVFTTNLDPYSDEDNLMGQIHTRNFFRIMQYAKKGDMTAQANLRGSEVEG